MNEERARTDIRVQEAEKPAAEGLFQRREVQKKEGPKFYPNLSPSMANHANLDTNAPHLASRGAFWHGRGAFNYRVGCKLLWGGVHLATGKGALWCTQGAS